MKKIISKFERHRKKIGKLNQSIQNENSQIDWGNKYKDDYLINIKYKKQGGKGSRPRVLTLPNFLMKINTKKSHLDSKMVNYKKQIASIEKKMASTIESLVKMESKTKTLENKNVSKSKTKEKKTRTLKEKKVTKRRKRPGLNSVYIRILVEEYSKAMAGVIDIYDKRKELSDKFSLNKTCEFVEYMNSK